MTSLKALWNEVEILIHSDLFSTFFQHFEDLGTTCKIIQDLYVNTHQPQ